MLNVQVNTEYLPLEGRNFQRHNAENKNYSENVVLGLILGIQNKLKWCLPFVQSEKTISVDSLSSKTQKGPRSQIETLHGCLSNSVGLLCSLKG